MTIDFETKKDIKLRGERKIEIISQCSLDAIKSATQEINCILFTLLENGMTGKDILDYAENHIDTLNLNMLKELTRIHGKNLVTFSEALEKRLSKRPALTDTELRELDKMIKEISSEYIIDQKPIIFKELDKHDKELLEMDSI